MSEQPEHTAQGARWPKMLLILSLAANVVIIGLFAGHLMKSEPSARGPDNQIRWIIRLVPEAQRDATKAHFREIRDDVRAAYMQRGDHLTLIADAIRVQPFSVEGLEAALQARRDGAQARQEIVQTHLVSLLESFSPAERAEFASNLDGFLAQLKERAGG